MGEVVAIIIITIIILLKILRQIQRLKEKDKKINIPTMFQIKMIINKIYKNK